MIHTHTNYQPNLEESFIDNNVQQRRNGQHGSFYNRDRVTRCDESRFNNLWVDKGNCQPQHNSTTYYPDTSINFSNRLNDSLHMGPHIINTHHNT